MNKNFGENTKRKSQTIMRSCIQTGVFTVCVLFSFNTFGNPLSNLARKMGDYVKGLSGAVDDTFSDENLRLIYDTREQPDPEITAMLNVKYRTVAKEIFGDDFFDKERFINLWEEDHLFRGFVAGRGLRKDRLIALGPYYLIRLSFEPPFIPNLVRYIDDSLKQASYNPKQISPDDEFWNLAIKATQENIAFENIFSRAVERAMRNAPGRNSGNRADRDW